MRFKFVDHGTGTLTTGTVFTVIDNISANPIFGTFSNLADGSTFTSNGNNFQVSYTCQSPPATISLIRNGSTVLGLTGSNFRISNCQYVYNLAASSLGAGTYKVNISIGGSVVGSGTFALK